MTVAALASWPVAALERPAFRSASALRLACGRARPASGGVADASPRRFGISGTSRIATPRKRFARVVHSPGRT